MKNFLDIIFPENIKCLFCGADIMHPNDYMICDCCKNNLPFAIYNKCKACGDLIYNTKLLCKQCDKALPPYIMARAPFIYAPPVSYAIQKLKFDNGKYIARPLACFLKDCYNSKHMHADVIIPVPLHKSRLKERGYNQSLLLSNELSKLINVPVKDILIKIKKTRSQAQLSYARRKANLKDSFKLPENEIKEIKNKDILIIDDVMTTGSTIETISKLIKQYAKHIYVLTVARTLYKDE